MKVAYIKDWGKNGTCYKQRLTVDKKEFEEINACLQKKYNEDLGKIKHLITSEQMNTMCFRKPLTQTENENGKYYLSYTQLCFIAVNFRNKRIRHENTILYLKEN